MKALFSHISNLQMDWINLFQINRGIVAYICFLKGATSGIIEKIGEFEK